MHDRNTLHLKEIFSIEPIQLLLPQGLVGEHNSILLSLQVQSPTSRLVGKRNTVASFPATIC